MKKPDSIVFDEISGKYDASLKEYPTDIGAPVIEVPNTVAWKSRNLHSVNSQLNSEFIALREAVNSFKIDVRNNQRIYNAKFNFEPIVGKIYFLYKNKHNEEFLSILAPYECNFRFIGSYELNYDKVWKEIK